MPEVAERLAMSLAHASLVVGELAKVDLVVGLVHQDCSTATSPGPRP